MQLPRFLKTATVALAALAFAGAVHAHNAQDLSSVSVVEEIKKRG